MVRTKDAKNIFMKKLASFNKLWILAIIVGISAFLRLNGLSQVPVSMFGDELDVGYHAYSILKTGRDYSGNFLPLHFHSLAEWRTPIYLYSAVPTVALFGITPLGVRLPAAMFGIATIPLIFIFLKRLRISEDFDKHAESLGILGAFLLAISPWHIQYSRAGFEVTELVFFILLGVTLFQSSLRNRGKYLWLSVSCLLITPLIYSTAKFFVPFIAILFFALHFRDVRRFRLKEIVFAFIAFFILGTPTIYSTIYGEGAQRFGIISIFTDISNDQQIVDRRTEDAIARNEVPDTTHATISDRIFHNKYTVIGDRLLINTLSVFSLDFLFRDGDPNPRHSIEAMGLFYLFEVIPFIIGIAVLITYITRRNILLLVGWIAIGIIPSVLTRDGGTHATRLFIVIIPFITIVALGWMHLFLRLRKYMIPLAGVVVALYVISFVSYQHRYWFHNTVQSERWWHTGWSQMVEAIKANENDFEKIIITTKDEPPWVFFAAWYQFDPFEWQKGYPFKKTEIQGFGEVSYIGKYYFGSPPALGIYEWSSILDNKTLYIASMVEVGIDLVKQPDRMPGDLRLVDTVVSPSGRTLFYLITKK